MPKVKLTILESRCRCGYFHQGDSFLVEDLCPPLCHELWACAYMQVYALRNGALLDCGDTRAAHFTLRCPDEGRVLLYGEALPEEN